MTSCTNPAHNTISTTPLWEFSNANAITKIIGVFIADYLYDSVSFHISFEKNIDIFPISPSPTSRYNYRYTCEKNDELYKPSSQHYFNNPSLGIQ